MYVFRKADDFSSEMTITRAEKFQSAHNLGLVLWSRFRSTYALTPSGIYRPHAPSKINVMREKILKFFPSKEKSSTTFFSNSCITLVSDVCMQVDKTNCMKALVILILLLKKK